MFKKEIYINIYVKLKFQTLYVRFAQCNVVFLRLNYHTSENEVYYGNTESLCSCVTSHSAIHQFGDLRHHCRLNDGTCIFFVFNAHTYMFGACVWVLCIRVWVLYMHVWVCVCMCVPLKSCRNFVILCEKDYIIKVCTVWVHSYWNKFRESQEQAYNLSKIYFFSEV